jgi:phosphohistidine phosphatase
MRIYLIRHGIAYEPGATQNGNDVERPLTNKGREKIHQVARALRALNVNPDVIISSPYVRARQTADIVARALKYKKDRLKYSETLHPVGQPEAIISEIIAKYMVEELVLVGHKPCLCMFISTLAAGDLDLAIDMKYGSVCCLSADDFRMKRRATIEWLVTPKLTAGI